MNTTPAAIDWGKIETLTPKPKEDVVPDGWFTVNDYAVNAGKSPTSALRILTGCLRSGTVELRQFRLAVNGASRAVNHYRIKS